MSDHPMRNFKLILSYDGTDFFGWQTQPGKRTVQKTLEDALRDLTGETKIHANASGRTDSGVHAVGQVVNFRSTFKYPASILQQATNARLPEDVVITSATEMDLDFDANRDAVRKLYRYVIQDGGAVNPFMRKYCCWSKKRLQVEEMERAARVLRGKHDFACFETEWPNRASSVRTISHLALSRVGDWIWMDVEADGFLYNMVRAIAGTLMNVGRGYWPGEMVRTILESKDRNLAGPTAPPQGLFLMRVNYDRD